MKECPFIDECEQELNDIDFGAFCQPGSYISYTHCPTYQQMLRTKQGKPPRPKPRQWKKEKEES